MIEALAGLESLPLAAALKRSVWLYPFVNTAHIVGIALLFGAIVPFDLRLLGVWPRTNVATLARVLLPTAVAGLLLAAAAGAMLFITRAGDYLASTYFLAKMGVLALVLAVAAIATLLLRRAPPGAVPGPVRLCAALSIGLWLVVITLGRLVGYF
ncbi:DUF2214 domain-containing protein [Microbaculum marinum]|uniref:DUF2214 domain-containing protein n=1 Tax=Microbaculum marinum TaxID=1764581 RepID=A0AAW9RDI4_9HYPH